MEPEPVSAREMNDKRRRTTESAAEGTSSNKGAAVKAAEATRREKTETVSVCYAANSLLRNGETADRKTGKRELGPTAAWRQQNFAAIGAAARRVDASYNCKSSFNAFPRGCV